MVPRRQHRISGRLRSPLRSETEVKVERLHTAHHCPALPSLPGVSQLPSSWPDSLLVSISSHRLLDSLPPPS